MPCEILAKVLHAATASLRPSFVPAVTFRSSPYSLPRLTRVCKRWRQVAYDYPDLWAAIDDVERQGFLLYLSRSKAARLIVYIHTDVKWSLEHIIPHLHHVEELHIEQELPAPGSKQSLVSLLRTPAPLLRSFTLIGRWDDDDDTTTAGPSLFRSTIFDAQCPYLRQITSSTWLTNLGNLTHVCLSLQDTSASANLSAMPSFSEFLDFLSENAGLQVLILSDSMHLPGEFYPTHPKVHLPHLQTLGFGYMTPAIVARVLAYVIMSEFTSINAWDIWWDFTEDNTTHLGSIFPQDLSGLPNLSTVCKIRCTHIENEHIKLIALGRDGQTISVKGPCGVRTDISWDSLHASHARTLLDLGRVFPIEHITDLWVGNSETTEPCHPEALWGALLPLTINLRKLVVINSNPRHILASLDSPSVPSPRIGILMLVHAGDGERSLPQAVRALVTARFQLGFPLAEVHVMIRYMRYGVSSWTEICGPTVIKTSLAEKPTFFVPPRYLTIEQERSLTG
jgi:hypothetical protein